MGTDRLSSWKEIAAFLRIDVKTAQRWEKLRGLPVRRIPGGRRGSVYALREEIEEWFRSAEAEKAQEPRAEGWRSGWRLWLAGLGGVAVVAAVALMAVRGGGAEIAGAEVRGRTLTALDKRGEAVWSMDLEPAAGPIQPVDGWPESLRTVRWRAGGRAELVAAVRHEKSTGPESEVLCFDGAGRRRWRWEVGFPLLDFNGQPFERNWVLNQILPDGTGGRTVVWAAVANPLRWASGLFRLDEEGRATLQFANAGSIMQVLRLGPEAGSKLLVAGVNNAFSRAFVAEIESDGPAAFSPPSGNDRYHFAEGPKGLPRVYWLLPESEIHRAGRMGYFHVRRLWQLGDRVMVEAIGGPESRSVYVYEFDLNLAPLRIRPTATGVGVHEYYESKGEIRHKAAECPEMTGRQAMRRWTAVEGWTEMAVPVAGPHTLR